MWISRYVFYDFGHAEVRIQLKNQRGTNQNNFTCWNCRTI